ncbi:hypothetical protein [Lapillicoccus sp.]|uniref:hypothetical protein n=1 Tax=Lapillicoccus sp. TaxID=1909287 RepID=UPI0025FD913E|nr:hypothetical protein [Lapillicoccus sp.]
MRVLVWILVWVVLIVLGALYIWSKGRVTWRQTKALGSEIAEASERLGAVQAQVDRLGESTDAIQKLAVFEDPGRVRAERQTTRRTLQEERRARRNRNLPTWARHVDS